jgi:hypothetical protein
VCFSAEADIVAGVIVTGVGVDALRHMGQGRELALAAIPVLFGVHQLIEVPVWWGVEGQVSEGVASGAAWLYLFIAFGVIPWIVPAAIRQLEPDRRRRSLMTWLIGLGVLVAAALTVPTVIGPITVTDGGHYLDYSAPLVQGGIITVLYVLATCGTFLLSSDRVVRIAGVLNLAVVATLAVMLTSGVISLWCVWAAVSSIAIAIHLRRMHRQPRPMAAVAH